MKNKKYIDSKWHKWIEKRLPKSSSIQLTSGQVFILPSKIGLVFMIPLAVSLVAAINFQNSLIYIVTFLFFSLFIVNIIQTWKNLMGIKIYSTATNPVFLDETINFNIILEGSTKAHHAINISIAESNDQGSVDLFSTTQLNLSIIANSRGYVNLPRFKVETSYPLGLATAWSYVELDQKVLVFPKPIENKLPDIKHENDPNKETNNPSTKTGTDDFSGLKPYQVGDNMNRISWKALSKGQGLLSKHFSIQEGNEWILDINHFSGPAEYKLSCLCYWVLKFHDQNQIFGLRLGSIFIKPSVGESHKNQVLKALALF